MKNTFKEIPLVFSVDDNYVPFLAVALRSILDNATEGNYYSVYVLNTEISKENVDKLKEFNRYNMSVTYVDVASRMSKINKDKIHLRDYYTKAIYYRIFIPSLFPSYQKILYLDCDVVLLEDVANLYNVDPEDKIMVVSHEETMSQMDLFGRYSEEFLGVKRENYFNSGVLLINSKEYKEENIEEKFIDFMHKHKFLVAPDQDYLNVLCKDRVKYISTGWNKTPFPNMRFDDAMLKLIHYKLNFKPWHYDNVRYQEYFWKYAEKTPYYQRLLDMKNTYSLDDKEKDEVAFNELQKTALNYTQSGKYKKLFERHKNVFGRTVSSIK